MATRAWIWVAVVALCIGSPCGCYRPATPPASIDAAKPRADLDYGACGSKPVLVVQDGASTLITVVALSPNGRILASSGAGNSIALWDTYTGLLLRRVPTDGPPEALAVSNDGETVAYGWTEKRTYFVRVVDVSGRTKPRAFDHALGFAISPNGGWFALATKGDAELYDQQTGKRYDLGVGPAATLAFDPTGTFMAASGAPYVKVVRLESFQVVEQFEPGFTAAGTDQTRDMPPNRLHFGEKVLAMEWAGSVAVGLLGTGGKVRQLPARGIQQFAAGGSRVVWPDLTGKLNVFDAATGETSARPPDPDLVGTYRLAMSGDGSRLAIASHTAGRPAVRLRDGRTLAPIRSMEGQAAAIAGVAATGDGALLVTSSQLGGSVAAWDLQKGEHRRFLPVPTQHPLAPASPVAAPAAQAFAPVAGDPAGARIAVAGPMGVTVFDANLQPTHQLQGMLMQPTMVAFAGPQTIIATSVAAGIFRWDLSKPDAPPEQVGGAFRAMPVAPSPDGSLIATASGLGVEVFRTDDAEQLWAERVNLVVTGDTQLAFTPDGTHVVAMFEAREAGPITDAVGRLLIFDAKTGRQVSTIQPGTAGPIAIHGGRIAVGGYAPAIVDWSTGEVVHRVRPPDQKITAVAAHPKLPNAVLMGGDGGSTSLVSLETGAVLAILRATTNGEYVTATPEGLYRASVDGARSIAWSFGCPLEAFPFSQFAKRYERPELIERALRGEAVTPPEPMNRPPFVRVAQAPKPETDQTTIDLPVQVASTSSVETVRVFVNGRAASEEQVGQRDAKLVLTVPLDPGRNRISVIAYDDAGMSSNPAVADVASAAVSGERPDLWIVAVGVSRYPRLQASQQLEVADDDARSIAHSFGQQAGDGKPYAEAHVTTLLDQQVTVQSLAAALAKLQRMKPRDMAVVFLAGHGLRVPGSGSVFLTSSASLSRASAKQSGVGWDRLSQALGKAKGRVLVLLDACHSGHLSTENVVPNDALAQQLSSGDRASVVVLAAARGKQLSYEVSSNAGSSRALELAYAAGGPRPTQPMPPEATGHGLFTAAVLEALGGEAIDIDQSRAIELGEFVAYVSERVRVMSGGKQTPWIVRQEMFGDFPLAPSSE
ncbi:MAG: caspase family protein [Deltaproteobacteria bacterium]|jgi:WD40 repeat protein/uncharacterized caspase-like protein|nr:caspase family protein [Deltaproteobacteria bacterium]MBW2532760.1 caspase family protein [Deltaproteobacteria bacterium]